MLQIFINHVDTAATPVPFRCAFPRKALTCAKKIMKREETREKRKGERERLHEVRGAIETGRSKVQDAMAVSRLSSYTQSDTPGPLKAVWGAGFEDKSSAPKSLCKFCSKAWMDHQTMYMNETRTYIPTRLDFPTG